jgi:hypothetical protein
MSFRPESPETSSGSGYFGIPKISNVFRPFLGDSDIRQNDKQGVPSVKKDELNISIVN